MQQIIAKPGIAQTRAPIARSYLFAPANNERLLGKVFAAGADAVVLDLEDAVPADQKQEARRLAANAISRHATQVPRVYVRVNAISTDLWRDDVAAVIGPHLSGI